VVPAPPVDLAAGDYGEIYSALQPVLAAGGWDASRQFATGEQTMDMAAAVPEMSLSGEGAMPADAMPAEGAMPADASGTNVQVEGIDEGDIVKTDGRYLYIGSGDKVSVVEAGGQDSRKVATITLSDDVQPGDGDTTLAKTGPVIDLMVADGRLAVMVNEYASRGIDDLRGAVANVSFDATMTKVILYDITDPAGPRFLTALGSSGAYQTSRLRDGVLYTVGTYRLTHPDQIRQDDPATFVPLGLDGSDVVPLPAVDIAVMPGLSDPAYAVVGAIDMAGGRALGRRAVLGGAEVVSMSPDNLYLAASDYSSNLSIPEPMFVEPPVPQDMEDAGVSDGAAASTEAPAIEGSGTTNQAGGSVSGGSDAVDPTSEPAPTGGPAGDGAVSPEDDPASGSEAFAPTDVPAPTGVPAPGDGSGGGGSDIVGDGAQLVNDGPVTQILRIDLNGRDLEIAAQGTLPGALLNQFAIDEFDGHVRVVTTANVTDKGTGWWFSMTNLRVLDLALREVGSVELVRDESVQSVRFIGSIGYVVTFKQVDPLFAVDVSNPQAPQILSALKIPGFSAYLHPWGEDRLIGFGVNADDAGWTSGLKWSVFDISKPDAVAEIAASPIHANDAEALNNHRAVWADPERGLLGVAVSDWETSVSRNRYIVFAVDDAGNVTERASIPLDDSAAPDPYSTIQARAVRVEDNLYICTSAEVAVLNLTTQTQSTTVKLES
jgi:uncharacterized secreted protein with C-terminal beta-propeller domain